MTSKPDAPASQANSNLPDACKLLPQADLARAFAPINSPRSPQKSEAKRVHAEGDPPCRLAAVANVLRLKR
jgi:hypothetical protein